jgi:hypothetical protein
MRARTRSSGEPKLGTDTGALTRLRGSHPEVANALNLTHDFVNILRKRDVDALSTWLAEAQTSSIREFQQAGEKRIERDRAAVEAALSREESNGQVEGQITKLKRDFAFYGWSCQFPFTSTASFACCLTAAQEIRKSRIQTGC